VEDANHRVYKMPMAVALAPDPHGATTIPTVAAVAGDSAKSWKQVEPTALPEDCIHAWLERVIGVVDPSSSHGITTTVNFPRNIVETKTFCCRILIGLLPIPNWRGRRRCGSGLLEAPATQQVVRIANHLHTVSLPASKSDALPILVPIVSTV